MWGNYALSLYRTLSRHRLYAALNILGLALGIAVCAVLLLVVRFEASFDRWVPGAANVYRVNALTMQPGRPKAETAGTQVLLLPTLMADFPQIRRGVRLWDLDAVVRQGAQQAREEIILADPPVFQMFGLPFVAGDRTTALADTSGLVISQTMARKYFGTEQALGRRLTVVLEGVTRDYRVTGVMRDVPANSHLTLDFVTRLSPDVVPQHQDQLADWGSRMVYTYLRLSGPADAAAIQAAMPAFVDRRVTGMPGPASRFTGFQLEPLTALHSAPATQGGFKPTADHLFVLALGIMGVVTLLIAAINYVSLATARAGMRAREVALRKVMGATRGALIVQFLAESVAMAVGASLVAAALIEIAVPAVSAVLGEPIRVSYWGPDGLVLPLLGLALFVGLLSGVYPALVLSGFRPASVLASARSPGGGRGGSRAREAMAVGQFAVAICLMICTAVIFVQIQFIRHADLGFRRDGLIIVSIGDAAVAPHKRALLQAFRGLPGATSVTASDRRPATQSQSDSNFTLVNNPAVSPNLTMERIGPDYARTYGVRVLAGRALGSDQRLDDMAGIGSEAMVDRGLNVMINVSGAHALDFPRVGDAVGQRVRFGVTDSGRSLTATVVGVLADVRFLSPRHLLLPQIYLQDTGLDTTVHQSSWSAAIRAPQALQPQMMQRIQALWRTMEPSVPLEAETVQASLEPYYDPDARRGQLFAAGAILACAIACLGLYGLAAFNTSRRFKEIGVRKTLGASTADVSRLLIGEFLRPVLWANLIAWPLAFFAMRAWLAGFDQRIALNPGYFLAPSMVAIVVAIATVASQALRVARAEPASALRYE